MRIVVTGPEGSGKALVGAAVASALRSDFVDGDGLHPRENASALAAGRALDDRARARWLDIVAAALLRPSVVVACSPLRRSDRDALRARVQSTVFVEIVAPPVRPRRFSRRDRAVPSTLLYDGGGQVEPLASDERGIRVAADADLPAIVGRITALFGAQSLR